MTIPGITSTLLELAQTSYQKSTLQSGQRSISGSNAVTSTDFASSLALRLAELRTQSVDSLLGSLFGGNQSASPLDFLTEFTPLSSSGGTTPGLSASGRNLSLFDPESAYTMMSVINRNDVTYKAQFAELSEMTIAVGDLQHAGEALGAISEATGNETIAAQLQTFVGHYNAWIGRFDHSVQGDGFLRGTQAAEVSLHELEQSVENVFNGAADGFHGLRDLGVSIDQSTNLATIDGTRLAAALAANRQGAINTISEFSTNFARSAELLVSSNNFLPNRLANLDRVIDYLSANKPALQAEFGLGDTARPSPDAARALAAYERMVNI